MHTTLKYTSIAALTSTLLSGCVSNDSTPMQLQQSRLSGAVSTENSEAMALARDNALAQQQGFQSLTPLAGQRTRIQSQLDLSSRFSNTGELTFSADEMPGDELVHTVFGELLGVNYVIADGIANLAEPMSLNLQTAVSPRQLYVMVAELLASRNIAVSLKDEVYFIHPRNPSQTTATVLGYGRKVSDIPNVPGIITQLVPLRFSQDASIERTIRQLTRVEIIPADGQSAYYFTGERAEILKAIDLLDMLDNPSVRGRHIGLLRLNYISVDEFSKKVVDVLATEGMPVDLNKPGNRNLVLIPIEHLGALAVFAADSLYIDRINYWAEQLDKPSQGTDKQYFMFYPRYARAADLGSSLSNLLGQSNSAPNQNRDTRTAQPTTTQNASNVRAAGQSSSMPKQTGALTAENEKVKMTVDERANAVIFYTTGKDYQDLLPMIQRLDTMPKQIVLEATIAEVTLTDEFAMGVEFALKNGRFNLGNVGAFGISGENGIGGTGFSYTDAAGLDKILGQLSKKDGKVNVISNPSVVVRDGVTANISVGTDLPIVTATTTNPLDSDQNRQINTQGYRKTGVELSVTPSISAQGLVVMEIDQSISNTAETDSSSTNPAIFERKIKTEVIAQSGQTILLGGLISENKSNSETKVPFLGDLPILGNLFKSQKESTTKTELVLLITPKVIDNTNQWQQVRERLNDGMQLLKLPAEKTSKEQ